MTRKTFLLNVGFARSGTTAAASFMKNHPDIAVPANRKELKYFMLHDAPIAAADYMSQFTANAECFFEASPPYAQQGLKEFRCYMERAQHLVTAGHRVVVVFCIRNFIKRAFSHYWHDISSQYAIYGAKWSCRSTDDPRRFKTLYTTSFAREVTKPASRDKFVPDAIRLIRTAIDIFGTANVRICQMQALDPSLHELCDTIGLPPRPQVKSFQIRSAAAPLYIPEGGKFAKLLPKADRARLSGTCLLFSRWHGEILDGKHFDLNRIRAAAQSWSYDLDSTEIPPLLMRHARNQAEAMATLPAEIFLQDCRERLQAELLSIPDRLSIDPQKPNRDQVLQLFRTLRPDDDGTASV